MCVLSGKMDPRISRILAGIGVRKWGSGADAHSDLQKMPAGPILNETGRH